MTHAEGILCPVNERCTVSLYGTEQPARAVIWLMGGHENEHLAAMLPQGIVLAAVEGFDWNRDMSPWPAPAVFRGNEDFGGQAESFLQMLLTEILPAAEDRIGTGIPRILTGYSLAGLFALWAGTRTDRFAACASVSGSVWFDGFTDYLSRNPFLCRHVYLSVGDREKKTRSERMTSVEEKARLIASMASEQGCTSVFQLNPGNHFADVPQRIMRGIGWCAEQLL